MKLIFLGDSFTYSWGIDRQYGVEKKIIKKNDLFIKDNYIFSELNNFRINNSWTKFLSEELNLEYDNLSVPGCSIEMIYCQFLSNEKKFSSSLKKL